MNTQSIKKTRIYSLDIIRSIAIVMVLLNHAVESCFNINDYETAISINSWNQSLIIFLFTIGRLGVPLFLMLTGYLLLHRDYDAPGSIKHFWIHNLLSIVITWEIWLVFYNIFLSWLNNTPFDWILWGRQALFVNKLQMYHSWYLPMIIGVYIFIPFLAKGIKGVSLPALYFLLAVCIATLFVIPGINVFYSAFDMDALSLQAQPLFWTSFSGVYIFMGHIYYLNTKLKKKFLAIRIPVDIAVVVIGVCVSVYLQIFLHKNMSSYMIWYSFFTWPPVAYCLFDLMYMIPAKRPNFVFARLSICSFAIYLIHRPVQMYFEQKVAFFDHTNAAVSHMEVMWILLILSLGISYGLAEGLGAIPYAGELLTRIRRKKFHLF